MITKKDLKEYGFTTMQDFYDYIVACKMNGNFGYVKELFAELSKDQRKEFLTYLTREIESDFSDTYAMETLKLCIEVIY